MALPGMGKYLEINHCALKHLYDSLLFIINHKLCFMVPSTALVSASAAQFGAGRDVQHHQPTMQIADWQNAEMHSHGLESAGTLTLLECQRPDSYCLPCHSEEEEVNHFQ